MILDLSSNNTWFLNISMLVYDGIFYYYFIQKIVKKELCGIVEFF